MRLRWILGLIVLTLALALAACGGGDDEDEEENGDDGGAPAATKTAEAGETETPEVVETETPEAAEPSGGGGGGASLSDLPVYPGADKTGDWSGDEAPLPVLGGEDVDLEDWDESAWATYETGDSWETVADWYKGKMTDEGWDEEGWYDFSFEGGVAWGSYTRDGGDSAAWVFVSGTEGEQTQIVIGAAHK